MSHPNDDLQQRLARLRDAAGATDCPSELALDQLHLGELDAGRAATLRSHIEGCDACEARMAQRAQGWEAYGSVDVDAMVARIHVATAGAPEEVTEAEAPSVWELVMSWLRHPAVVATLATGAAAAVALLAVDPEQVAPPVDGDTTRFKGGPALNVQVKPAGGGPAASAFSGDSFHAGDTLQFTVDLPEAAHVLVVGVEADGATTYVAWPLGAESAVERPAGSSQRLEGAVELDGTPGSEWLHVVACAAPFTPSDVDAGERAGQIAAPEGCRTAPFELKKSGPAGSLP